jgi:hypothetical protein
MQGSAIAPQSGTKTLVTVVLKEVPLPTKATMGNFSSIDGIHCKKRFQIFPSPAVLSLTKLSLARNNLISNEYYNSCISKMLLDLAALPPASTRIYCTLYAR